MRNPVPGTDTVTKLEWLNSPEGRRSGMRPTQVSADTLTA
jgi:hypothetical protein